MLLPPSLLGGSADKAHDPNCPGEAHFFAEISYHKGEDDAANASGSVGEAICQGSATQEPMIDGGETGGEYHRCGNPS